MLRSIYLYACFYSGFSVWIQCRPACVCVPSLHHCSCPRCLDRPDSPLGSGLKVGGVSSEGLHALQETISKQWWFSPFSFSLIKNSWKYWTKDLSSAHFNSLLAHILQVVGDKEQALGKKKPQVDPCSEWVAICFDQLSKKKRRQSHLGNAQCVIFILTVLEESIYSYSKHTTYWLTCSQWLSASSLQRCVRCPILWQQTGKTVGSYMNYLKAQTNSRRERINVCRMRAIKSSVPKYTFEEIKR